MVKPMSLKARHCDSPVTPINPAASRFNLSSVLLGHSHLKCLLIQNDFGKQIHELGIAFLK